MNFTNVNFKKQKCSLKAQKDVIYNFSIFLEQVYLCWLYYEDDIVKKKKNTLK